MPLRHRVHRVVYVPLDDRPVNLRMPQLLAQMVEYECLVPPGKLLGNFHTPGQPEAIGQWLLSQLADHVDCVIASLDMLAYGGLLASRQPDTSGELAAQRLRVLAQIRKIAPEVTIYASSVIMGQAPIGVGNDTGRYRQLLGDYSQLKARRDAEDDAAQRQALQQLEQQIPPPVRDRYLSVRERNHQVNELAIEQVAAGNIDFLVLPQDDAGQQGLHIGEQQHLRKCISDAGLEERVMIYPGADEVGMTLLARFVHQHMEKQPAVRVIYADQNAAENIADFEDRPFTAVVAAQLAVVGARPASQDETPALTLLISPPAGLSRQEAAKTKVQQQRQARLSAAVKQVIEMSPRRGIAICDAAFPNGADDEFVAAMLAGGMDPSQLLSYGAWNTASNSLGSVLAHSMLRLIALQDKGAFDLVHLVTDVAPMRYLKLLSSLIRAQQAHIQFLFTRFVDDWLYQSQVRPEVSRQLAELVSSSAFDLHQTYSWAEQMVRSRLLPEATNLWIEQFLDRPCVEIGPEGNRQVVMLAEMEQMHVSLPWRRLFEVELEFKLNMELAAISQ